MSSPLASTLPALASVSAQECPAHLAIGIFDGVHRGHQSVVGMAVQAARTQGKRSGVLTFSPHPSHLFRPQEPTRLIMPLPLKARKLAELGADITICEPFTPEFAALEAEDFVAHLHAHLSGLDTLYVGENFRFGKKRRGDPTLMAQWAHERGIHVVSVPHVRYDGEVISSTRIRKSLEQGKLEQAAETLGSPYTATGSTVRGKQLGRTLGFPTLNLPWQPELAPPLGVYAVRVRSGGSSWRNGVGNYGLRPTVEAAAPSPLLEIHLLDADCPWDYGSELEVQWLKHLRPERTFDSQNTLSEQIQKDCETAKAYHANAAA